MNHQFLREHADLVYDIAIHPRRKVTSQFHERVRHLVYFVQRHACFFSTRYSVFKRVKNIAMEELGYYPEYSVKQRELLDILDYCCMYPQAYEPMD